MQKRSTKSVRAALAENIRAFRKQLGLSQEALADLCELHRTYIGSIEREERNVSLSTLETLARAFEISVPELLIPKEANARQVTPRLQKRHPKIS